MNLRKYEKDFFRIKTLNFDCDIKVVNESSDLNALGVI